MVPSTRMRSVVRTKNVERHARRAIAQRLGHADSAAIVSVTRDDVMPETVVLHVTSGGNAEAASVELRRRGYRVDPTPYDPYAPGHYGVQLRVGPQEALPGQTCEMAALTTNPE